MLAAYECCDPVAWIGVGLVAVAVEFIVGRMFLADEFATGFNETHGDDPAPTGTGRALSLNAGAISVAAWAMAAEGLEILVVRLGGGAVCEGAITAALSVFIGLAIIAILGCCYAISACSGGCRPKFWTARRR